jgi:dihydropteroate synthase
MLNLTDLHKIADENRAYLHKPVEEFDVGNQAFRFNTQSYLMGVINLSPDSWYRESVCLTTEQAIRRGCRLVADGAHLVDVGAESSLLDTARQDEGQQKNRLLPVIRGLSERGILVSVETYHPGVAESCLEAGAMALNLTGTTQTTEIFRSVSKRKAAVILCYVEGENVRSVNQYSLQEDMIPRMKDYFAKKIDEARSAGVTRIFVDPGLGFYYRNLQDSAIRVRHQMHTFLHTFRLRELGWPTCHALPHAFEYFEDEVRSAEGFFAVLALLGKTNLLRTHEVRKVRGVCRTLETWNPNPAIKT